ncbi:MAG TPA: hypothetical protein VME46_24595 [Acidimicrobiales bacterium]|nr:hypothetical protein [Acidimicrobiales bacterium]
MKPHLLYADADLDLAGDLPAHQAALRQDLGLDLLCGAMAGGDHLVFEVSKRALLFGLAEPEEVSYRQGVLADTIAHPAVVRDLYRIAGEAVEAERKVWGLYSGSPQSVLSRALGATSVLSGYLRQLRNVADEHAPGFCSEGFSRFFKVIEDELSDDYLRAIDSHLRSLRFDSGKLISARLGEGNTAVGFVLRSPKRRGWRERLGALRSSGFSFEVSSRDEGGCRVLEDIQARAINLVANALAQSAEHIRGFFSTLQAETAFYVGCLDLRERLGHLGMRTSLPEALPTATCALWAEGLYDVCLALRSGAAVVGNDLHANDKSLIVLTGANQGGKSTFLRAIGLAQMMMQAGMFVPAASFRGSLRTGVFTHFKREEDKTMRSGKLDEELGRMSTIADLVRRGSLLLCNESFASTNEREGSEIARGVVEAMASAGVRVVFVTHLFELANGLYAENLPMRLFLRAERLIDGTRTFRLLEGAPLATSHGRDCYEEVFGCSRESDCGYTAVGVSPPGEN